MSIGTGWAEGAWVDAGWITEAWSDVVPAPITVPAENLFSPTPRNRITAIPAISRIFETTARENTKTVSTKTNIFTPTPRQ